MKIRVIMVLFLFLITGYTNAQSKKQTKKGKTSDTPLKHINVEGTIVKGMKAPKLNAAEWLSDIPDMKGKFVALDFWGPSCKPCIAGFPHINELNRKYRDEVVFIATTTNDSPGDVYSFEAGAPVEFYSMMVSPKSWNEEYKIQGIPHLILVDPSGVVRYSGNGFELSDAMLDDIIKNYKTNSLRK